MKVRHSTKFDGSGDLVEAEIRVHISRLKQSEVSGISQAVIDFVNRIEAPSRGPWPEDRPQAIQFTTRQKKIIETAETEEVAWAEFQKGTKWKRTKSIRTEAEVKAYWRDLHRIPTAAPVPPAPAAPTGSHPIPNDAESLGIVLDHLTRAFSDRQRGLLEEIKEEAGVWSRWHGVFPMSTRSAREVQVIWRLLHRLAVPETGAEERKSLQMSRNQVLFLKTIKDEAEVWPKFHAVFPKSNKTEVEVVGKWGAVTTPTERERELIGAATSPDAAWEMIGTGGINGYLLKREVHVLWHEMHPKGEGQAPATGEKAAAEAPLVEPPQEKGGPPALQFKEGDPVLVMRRYPTHHSKEYPGTFVGIEEGTRLALIRSGSEKKGKFTRVPLERIRPADAGLVPVSEETALSFKEGDLVLVARGGKPPYEAKVLKADDGNKLAWVKGTKEGSKRGWVAYPRLSLVQGGAVTPEPSAPPVAPPAEGSPENVPESKPYTCEEDNTWPWLGDTVEIRSGQHIYKHGKILKFGEDNTIDTMTVEVWGGEKVVVNFEDVWFVSRPEEKPAPPAEPAQAPEAAPAPGGGGTTPTPTREGVETAAGDSRRIASRDRSTLQGGR